VKILTITSSYPKYSGDTTAPFIESITRALAARGHELAVVLPARSDLDPEPIDGVSFHPYSYAPSRGLEVFGYAESLKADVAVRRSAILVAPLAVASGAAKLLALARRGQFDVILAHWVVPGAAMALPVSWTTGLPMVASLHGSDVFVSEKSFVFRTAAGMAFGRASAVTACSDDLAERSLALGASPRPTTIPYGVSTEIFGPLPDEAMRLRGELGLDEKTPLVLAVGRLVHKKGFEYLIDAMPRIGAKHPDCQLIIAGQGDLESTLTDRAGRLGVLDRVRFVGNVARDALPAYYASATVVAVPSVRDDAGNVDGLPNVLLEGMASGTPLVASAVAGIPQAARDGSEALLVAERDPEALARAIVDLLDSPQRREELGRAARSRAQEVFDWSRVGEQFEDVLGSVTEAGRSSS
jgi:glycosyltransferase involved in cell wall biosynthesis